MGEVEEERSKAEEEQRIGEGVMEEMEEEGRKRNKIRFSSRSSLPSPLSLSPPSPPFTFLPFLSPPSPPFTFLPFLSPPLLPSPSFPFSLPPLLPSPSFPFSLPLSSLHLPSLSLWPLPTSWRIFLPHTDTTEENKKNCKLITSKGKYY